MIIEGIKSIVVITLKYIIYLQVIHIDIGGLELQRAIGTGIHLFMEAGAESNIVLVQ